MRHLLLVISLIGLAIAIVAFINNRAVRYDIRAELKKFDLKTPEEHLFDGYSRNDLQEMAGKLGTEAPGGTKTLLELYRRPALLWNDVIFAIALGIFAASLWAWVLLQFEPSGALRYLFIVMAWSSLVYAVVDTAEDLVLERVLRTPDAITDNEAWTASMLTRLKGLSIMCSGAGGVVFLILDSKVPPQPKPLF